LIPHESGLDLLPKLCCDLSRRGEAAFKLCLLQVCPQPQLPAEGTLDALAKFAVLCHLLQRRRLACRAMLTEASYIIAAAFCEPAKEGCPGFESSPLFILKIVTLVNTDNASE
jgi:hypothetical protein